MAKYFICELEKPAISYKCDELISFKIFARERCRNIDCKYIRWQLKTDDGVDLKGIGSCTSQEPLVIETTLKRAGFARLICDALADGGNVDGSFEQLDAGAGADVEKICYHDTLPDDFYDYWQDLENLIAQTEPQVLMCEELKVTQEGFKTYDMRVKTPEGRPASFVLTIPEGEGEYPIKSTYLGYGVHPATPIYNNGMITAVFNAHGIENHLTSVDLIKKYKGVLEEGYGFSNEENASNIKTYWRGMVIRCLMGVKYLKTLKEWDKKTLILAGGSQGAFQALSTAAHTNGVTYLEIDIPAFCDMSACEKGYMRGWRPDFSKAFRYLDPVAQSVFLKCPVKITAGLGDYICPPSGVMALYNSIKTLKSITFIQASTHGYRPNEKVCFTLNFDPENPSGEFKKGKYRHFKGNEYEVLDVALNCETLEETVVYKALYGEGKVWIRPKSDFCGFVFRDNRVIKRFEFIG